MKHLLKKINSRGGGKKPKVTPAVLNPPKIGDFQFGASFSIAENIDLISDGPIEGLVDPEGNLLPPSQISRGVYLDGTAVSVATESFEPEKPIEDAINIKIDEGDFSEVFGEENVENPAAFYSAREDKRFRYVLIHPLRKGKPSYRTHFANGTEIVTDVRGDGGYYQMTDQSDGLIEGDPNIAKYYVRTRKGGDTNAHSGFVLLNEDSFANSSLVYCLSMTNSNS